MHQYERLVKRIEELEKEIDDLHKEIEKLKKQPKQERCLRPEIMRPWTTHFTWSQ